MIEINKDNKKMWNYTNRLIGKIMNNTVDETILIHFRAENIINIVEKFEQTLEGQVKNWNATAYRQKTNNTMKEMKQISVSEIKNILQKFSEKTLTGIDKIRIRGIKNNIDHLAKIIKTLIDHPIKHNGIHSNMKTTIIRSIYKKRNHADFNNYRKIAIQNGINKIL